MADSCTSCSQTPDLMEALAFLEGSRTPMLYSNSPSLIEANFDGSPRQPFMVGADAELKALL